jgi:hypothetical protein
MVYWSTADPRLADTTTEPQRAGRVSPGRSLTQPGSATATSTSVLRFRLAAGSSGDGPCRTPGWRRCWSGSPCGGRRRCWITTRGSSPTRRTGREPWTGSFCYLLSQPALSAASHSAVSISETSLSPSLATYRLWVSGSIANPSGYSPVCTVATIVRRQAAR